jgi:dipeptidase E
MKLLLTSGGIMNNAIKNALQSLIARTPQSTKIGFIPTAANVEPGNKDWFLSQLDNLRKFGFSWIDIIDPSSADTDWRARLRDVDVVFVSGGNTFHLLNQFRKTGFDKWLKTAVKEKVYVGVSAGSIIATPTIDVAAIPPGDPNLPNIENLRGLNFVGFEVEPHCSGGRFATIEYYAQSRSNPVYAIDDETALKVDGKSVEVVSQGKWKLYR